MLAFRPGVRRALTLAAMIALPLLAGVAAGWSGVAAAPAAHDVVIDNFAFGPPTLTVPRGTTVTWINKDDEPHTVVSDSKLFKSSALDTDDSFTFTFSQAGTFKYFCTIHPRMQGTVIVQ